MSRKYEPFEPEFLTGASAARRLGMERSKFQRAVKRGEFTRHHPDGVRRAYFAVDELDAFRNE